MAAPERFHPWRELARTDTLVYFTAPTRGVTGWWDPDRRAIWIDPSLGQAGRRSTLTHELVHAERDDESCAAISEWHERKQEAAVDAEAARRLITTDQLVDALRWTSHIVELADELWVDGDTVLARLECLSEGERRYIEERIEGRWVE